MFSLNSIILDSDIEQSNLLLTQVKRFKFIHILSIESNPRTALSKILFFRPDVVFMEVETPELDGFEMIQLFYKNNYYPKVIFTSYHTQYCIKAIRIGVFDYLLKPFENEVIKNCVKRLNTRIYADVILSSVENQIISYLTKGFSSKEIASHMNLSTPAISYHKTKILRKYQAKTTAELLIKI